MKHLGDYDLAGTIYGKFTTYRPSSGAAFTLAGTPAVSVYKDGSATQSTTGVTLTADFDGVAGLNHVAVDTSADGTFYSAGSHFEAVVTTGTVDGVSVVGAVVFSFSLRKDSSLKPTTAGRTLDVSAGGEAGLDWANIGSPTTAVNLSATNIDVDQVVASVSGAVGSVTGAVASVTGNVGGNVTGSVGTVNALAANVITAAATATDFGTEVGTAVWATTARVLTANTNLNDLNAAGVRAAVGLASANLDTQLTAIDDFIDTEVAAIKAKTDQLVFTVANQVDVNVLDWKSATAPAMTGDAFARLGAPAGASVSADIATIAGYVDTEVAAIFSRIGAPVGASISADIAAVKTDTAAVKVSTDKLDDTVELTSDAVYVFSRDALANAPSGSGGGSGPTAVEIANEVQTRTIAAVTVVNGLAANVITAAATATDFTTEVTAALATSTALAAVQTDVDDIQTRLPSALVSGRMDSSTGAMAANVMTAAAAAADLTTELQAGLATAAALTTVAGNVTSIKASTDNLPTDPADASVVAGLIAAVSTKVDTVDTNVDAILLDTGTDGVVVAAAAKTGYRLSSAGVDDVLRTALTEGYAADGAAFTLEQALYMLWSLLAERSIAGTTLTAKKLDGSTNAMTFTLDDGTLPTAQTRAT